uniref:uncharacterized protein LOC122585096 n=1 Tax=Erigeron canadensis TaxID=72917 RepID=UPI001CB9B5FD|nr:uncharacterized protein LOC122585096 [Erigeron canadensis]
MYHKPTAAPKWQKPITIKLPFFITLITLIIFLLLIILIQINTNKPTSHLGLVNQKITSLNQPMFPKVEIFNKTEVIWQIPKSPKSLLFLAHGCNGRASNFWDKSLSCQHCVGLPEEKRIVLEALARNFAVIAVSSKGKCWSLVKEVLVVEKIIKLWVKKHNLEKLPFVALGASSGGYFVSMLASKMKFSSIVIMIAEGVFDRINVTKDYPPTLFVHMPKDKSRKRIIDVNVENIRTEGVDVAEVQCMELPLSPNFLADRVPGLDMEISVKLFDMFKEKGFINKEGYLINDGRVIPWKEAMTERKISLPNKLLVSYIQEELNLAFAYHEMTSLQSEQIFNWFESHMR